MKMKLVISSALALLLVTVALAAGEKRMTIEDSLSIRTVGAPQFSPDGKWVAYTLSEWDRKEDRRVSHIWLAATDGSRNFRLTSGEKGENAPQWSPDGTRIAFLADRSAAPAAAGAAAGAQIWIIQVAGGEAEKLTSEEGSIAGFRWSPDGRRIAYVIRDVHKDKAEREKRKKDKFDTIVMDSDYLYTHLWAINVESKGKKRITEGAFTVAGPQWSPDGKWIAYAANTEPQSWAAKTDILIISPEGGEPRNVTKGFFESAGFGLNWSPDGKTIYFTSGVGLYSQIYSAAVATGKVSPVTKGNRNYGAFDLSNDGRWLAFTVNDNRTWDDIHVAAIGSEQSKQITQANPQLKDFALADTEVVKWKGQDNFDIEGVLVKPLGYQAGRKYPLILQIHGGPYGKFSDGFNSRAQIWAALGYAVLMPNPRGSTGYGHAFTVANVGDWGGKDFQDIMAGVDAVIAKGVADADKCVVMGGSYGGFMTFWTITQTDRFKAAIGHAAISDWYSFYGQSDIPGLMEYGFNGLPWISTETYRKWSPMTYIARVKTPILITHGERDMRVNIQQGEQYYRALRKRGVETVFLRYPREGHGIQEPNHQIDLQARQLEWFDKHLGITRPKPADVKAASVTENR